MKWIVFALLILFSLTAGAEEHLRAIGIVPKTSIGYTEWFSGTHSTVVTDSIVWRTAEVDSLNLGSSDCKHKWVYSETWRAGGNIGCAVLHWGSHCSYDDRMRGRICSVCKRHETQRQQWYEHSATPPKTEYEKLEELLKKDGKETTVESQ